MFSLKPLQNKLHDSADDYAGTGQDTSAIPPTRDGITDNAGGPTLRAILKKSFNIEKNILTGGENLLKLSKKLKKVRSVYEP